MLLSALLLALDAGRVVAQEGLPDPRITPGAVNEAIDSDAFARLCTQKGWTRRYRPGTSFTNALKRQQLRAQGLGEADPADYEEDHLVPLCLAGAPEDPRNLWPQPRGGQWNARRKDRLEALLCRLVCEGSVGLQEAQREMAADWTAAFERHLHRRAPRGEPPDLQPTPASSPRDAR